MGTDNTVILYIECKTGYADDGPAWIGKALLSQSGKTVYFNDHAFHRYRGGCCANYYDMENGDNYWISGCKKNGQDRHPCGSGKIMIDERVVDEYLKLTHQTTLNPRRFTIVQLEDSFPVDRIFQRENTSPCHTPR